MDTVSLREYVFFHSRIPTLDLVPKVHTGFKQIFHGHYCHVDLPLPEWIPVPFLISRPALSRKVRRKMPSTQKAGFIGDLNLFLLRIQVSRRMENAI